MRDILGKFLKLVKQRRTALIILVIFWVLLISIQDPFSDMPAAERVYGESYKGGVEIQTGQVISEEIPCSLNGLCELNIQLSNKSDDPEANTALIKVDVLDNTTNQVVASQTIAGSKISSLYTDEISFSPLGD